MPRRLVLIPLPFPLDGMERIDAGYPRPYTERDMRGWAADVDRALVTDQDVISRLERLPREERAADEQRLLDARRHFLTEPALGVRGTLRPDGAVEIDGGRHRASYIAEQGTLLPVWVSSDDARRLDGFAARCERDAQSRLTRLEQREAGRRRDVSGDRDRDRV